MSFVEMKELAFIVLLVIVFAPVFLYAIGYIFAKVTYKNAHTHKRYRIQPKPLVKDQYELVFNIDSKNKTLQEIQSERNRMIKFLGGF